MKVRGEMRPLLSGSEGTVFEKLLDLDGHLVAEGLVGKRGARISDDREGRGQLAVQRQLVQRGHDISLRLVRSPLAPKITMAHSGTRRSKRNGSAKGFCASAIFQR